MVDMVVKTIRKILYFFKNCKFSKLTYITKLIPFI